MQTKVGAQIPFDNDNGSGGSLWNIGNNWDGNALPTSADAAVIPAGIAGVPTLDGGLSITDSSGSFSTSAVCGTLVVATDTQGYARLKAYNVGFTTQAATLTFGTSSAAGGFDFVPVPDSKGDLRAGFFLGETGGTLTAVVPRHLNMRSTPTGIVVGTIDNRTTIINRMHMIGAGSVTYGTITGIGTADVVYNIGAPIGNSQNLGLYGNYSGGTSIQPDTNVVVFDSSTISGGTLTRGPLGIGTVQLNGGTLVMSGSVGGQLVLDNAFTTLDESTIRTAGVKPAALTGSFRTGEPGARRVNMSLARPLTFDNANFSSTDTGTIAFLTGGATDQPLEFLVDTGTSTYGGYVGEGTSAPLAGNVEKSGAGTFATRALRVGSLTINSGVLVATASSGGAGTLDIVGNNDGISRTGLLTIDSSAAFDLKNNDLVIDYSGTSTLGTINNGGTFNPSGHVAEIITGYNSGSWNGNGIRASSALVNASKYALGYAEANDIFIMGGSGTALFGSQVVDSTTALIAFTYRGDANLSGTVDLDDFTRLSAGFGAPGEW